MSNVQKFEELLSSDEALQAKMRELVDAYNGDGGDERAFFEAVMAPLSQEAGLPFTFEEGVQYVSSERELNDAELDAVAGGSGCWLIGGSNGPDADACSEDVYGANACAYVGVGFYVS